MPRIESGATGCEARMLSIVLCVKKVFCKDVNLSYDCSFAMGVFVLPNTIDFNYVFAAGSFNDNVTIYMTIIFCLLLYIVMLVWAR